jgi:hypothetical protein
MSPFDTNPVSAEPTQSRFRPPHCGWFLLVTVALAIGNVSVSVWLPWRREQQVIPKIEGWGGVIGTKPLGGPQWLRQLVGEHRMRGFKIFDRIDSVDLSGSEITDAEIIHLTGLTELDWLSLADTAVTDIGMAYLSKLKMLRVVDIHDTAVTMKGIDVLQPAGLGPTIRTH